MAGEKGHTPKEVAEILRQAEAKKAKALSEGVDPVPPGVLIEKIETLGPDALEEVKKNLKKALEE